MKIIFVWLLAIVFLIDSVLRAIRSSFNLGVLMMYLITAALWMYALFHTKIDAFCAAGAGRVLKIIFFCCCAVFALLLIFVAVSGYSDTATKQEKAVIVLGAGLRGERVTDLLARRLDAAYDYHLENPNAVIVVTGGQGPGEDIPEARAMKAYLVEKGVPGEANSGRSVQYLHRGKFLLCARNFGTARSFAERTRRVCHQCVPLLPRSKIRCRRRLHKCERHPRLYRLFFRTPLLYA